MLALEVCVGDNLSTLQSEGHNVHDFLKLLETRPLQNKGNISILSVHFKLAWG